MRLQNSDILRRNVNEMLDILEHVPRRNTHEFKKKNSILQRIWMSVKTMLHKPLNNIEIDGKIIRLHEKTKCQK